MKTYAEKTITHKELVEVRCDLCGVATASPATTVELDSQDGVKTAFDVCPACFVEKLVPWFDSHGALPRVTEAGE